MATYPEVVPTPPASLEEDRPDYYARYFGDPISRLFWQEGHLHLGILPSQAMLVRKLIADGTISDLVSDGWIADFERTSSAYSLFADVYRLAETPRIIYWYEWSPEMLRAAASHMMRLLKTLLDRDLTPRNPHPWNLLYDGTRFQYINPGSIVPFDAEEFRRAWDKVLKFLVRPTLLASQGKFTLCRSLLGDIHQGVPQGIVDDQDWRPSCFESLSLRTWLASKLAQLDALSFTTTDTQWLGYHNHGCFQGDNSWTRKQLILERFVQEKRPASVLDLAANSGYYARVAASHGCEAIATDVEGQLVDQIFQESRPAKGLLYPALLDFTNPTPALGIGFRWFPAATQRMRADLVLCYALEHHLVRGKYRLDSAELAFGVASFSSRAALVEHIPLPITPWHTAKELAQAFRTFFAIVEVLPGSADDRQLILCDRRFQKNNEECVT